MAAPKDYSGLPEPLVPAECSTSGDEWFPLYFDRLRKSKWWRRASDMARARNVMLWGEAYKAEPPGSLPDDDDELAEGAGFGMDVANFLAAKAEIMEAWTLCRDGRWYHPTVCEQVLDSWERRSDRRKAATLRQRKRRERVRTVPAQIDDVTQKSGSVTPDTGKVTRDAADVTRDKGQVTRDFDIQDKTGQDSKDADASFCAPSVRDDEAEPSPRRRASGRPSPPTQAETAAFDAFWAVYPLRKDKKRALEAFVRTLRSGVNLAEIMAGAQSYAGERAGRDASKTKYAQGWLNDQRWTDEPEPASAQVIPLAAGRARGWSALEAGIAGLDFDGENDERRG